jgi:hypothetical protein
VDYGKLTPLIIAGVQEQQRQLAALDLRIDDLEQTAALTNGQLSLLDTRITNNTNQIATLTNQLNGLKNGFSTDRLGIGMVSPATDSGKLINTSSGAYLSDTGVWTNVSDVNKKENFTDLDKDLILDKIASLPVTQWNYRGSGAWHIGPTAQDFFSAFQLGDNNTTISTLDPAGVALIGIQALNDKLVKLNSETDQLKLALNGGLEVPSTWTNKVLTLEEQVAQLQVKLAEEQGKRTTDSEKLLELESKLLGLMDQMDGTLTASGSSLEATDSGEPVDHRINTGDLSLAGIIDSSGSAELLSGIEDNSYTSLESLAQDVQLLKEAFYSDSTSSQLSSHLYEITQLNLDANLNNLVVADKTVLNNVGITGELTAGIITVNGLEGSISTIIGPLKLQTGILAGNIEAFNGKIVMTAAGDIDIAGTMTAFRVQAKELVAEETTTRELTLGKLTVATQAADLALVEEATASVSANLAGGQSTATDAAELKPNFDPSIGDAIFPAKTTKFTVKTTAVSKDSKIFITPLGVTDRVISVIEIEPGVGFTVGLKYGSFSDIRFNWWIIN